MEEEALRIASRFQNEYEMNMLASFELVGRASSEIARLRLWRVNVVGYRRTCFSALLTPLLVNLHPVETADIRFGCQAFQGRDLEHVRLHFL